MSTGTIAVMIAAPPLMATLRSSSVGSTGCRSSARSPVRISTAALDCPVPEAARPGRTLTACNAEFLAGFDHPEVSNGPTEALNLKIKNTKRIARGFRNFTNYRLRPSLNHGRIRNDHLTSRIRTRRPSLVV